MPHELGAKMLNPKPGQVLKEEESQGELVGCPEWNGRGINYHGMKGQAGVDQVKLNKFNLKSREK